MSVSLLKVVADLNLSLASAVSAGTTTATLNTAVDSDGVALPSGKYGFTVDGDNASKEFFVCDLVGTALTNVQSISKQGVATTGFSTYHRTGAVVTITDWTVWKRAIDNLTGVTGFDSGTALKYDGQPTLSDPTAIPTVQYVLDTVSGGTVTFDRQIIAGDAGENVSAGDWVYFDTTDGEWYLTDADDTTKSLNVRIGKAIGAGTNGNPIAGGIFVSGTETVGTYVAGTVYYLSNTAGALSTSAGTNSVVVGVGDANGDLQLRLPTANQVDAIQGGSTFGTPSSVNKFLTQDYNASATGLPVVRTYTTASSTIGGSTTQFDITNPSGTTFRYTWDSTGTDPGITALTVPTGSLVDLRAQNFTGANNGLFLVTSSGSNFFEVTNASGVAESNKTIGTGYIIISGTAFWTKPAGLKYIEVEQVGAGGAGDNTTFGGGGGGGGYSRKLFATASLGATVPYIVGSASVATTGGTLPGSLTAFGLTLVSNGGTTATTTTSADGGTSTGGDINIQGGSSTVGDSSESIIGAGGNTFFGGGGTGTVPANTGAGGPSNAGGANGRINLTEYFS